MPHAIRAFLFDMGNVLIRFSHDRMHAQMADVLGARPEAVRDLLAEGRRQWLYECGVLTTDELLGHVGQLATKPFEREALVEAISDIFEPIEPMRGVVRGLKSAGFRLVLVSNTNELHVDHIRARYDLLEPFDELVLSYSVRAMKPDSAFYDAALRAAGCAPSEALFTDDLPENVEGARRCGIRSLIFSDPERFRHDLTGLGIALPLRP